MNCNKYIAKAVKPKSVIRV